MTHHLSLLSPSPPPRYVIDQSPHQAVIRLSKQYLPGMAAGYNHPKVKVHVGDGFKFLNDYKNSFDVIITDSSDPEGPAESLFQKPYFQLLHDALREGGVISTQGCTFPSSLDAHPRKMLTQAITACPLLLEHPVSGFSKNK